MYKNNNCPTLTHCHCHMPLVLVTRSEVASGISADTRTMTYFTRATNLNIYPQSSKTIVPGAASAFTLAATFTFVQAKYSVHGNHFSWSLGTIREGKNFIKFFVTTFLLFHK